MTRVTCAALAALAVGASAASAQPTSTLRQKLDAIAGAGVREGRSVGLAAAVVKGKDRLLVEAYGKSDVDAGTPATPDTVFAISSDSKQFTAAAILQLRDAGKLTIDDEITKWLPDFETAGNKVTLRHLLGHTSGITDLGDMPELRALRVMRNAAVTRDDLYKIVSRYKFQFPTGTMQAYSNTNYWLLGLVIEKASGMPYEDYVEQRIFKPLGMTRSMYCSRAENVTRRARPYGMRSGAPVPVPPIVHTATFSAGALCSTVEDLVTWLQALHGGKVLPAKSYVEMITPSTLSDGTQTRYAMGLVVGEDSRGQRYIGHDGGGFGFSSQTRWYRDAQLAIVLLTNSEPDETTAISENLAAFVLPPLPPARPFAGDAQQLAGTYKGPGRGRETVIAITQTPDGLAAAIDGAPAVPLTWVERWTFRQGSSLLVFRRTGGGGPATELRFDRGGGHFILKRQ